MALQQFEHPKFDWDTSDKYQEFLRFKQHVDFVFKGPLCDENVTEKAKAAWLGLWIGQQGREVYKTFQWDGDEQDKPETVLNKLEQYVRPTKNVRASRYRLFQRKQSDTETFDNFVKDLRLIVMDCGYTNPDDILVDVIIAGVRHSKVQERMLDKGDKLTLVNAIELGRQYEISQQQLKMIRGEEAVSAISQNPGSKQFTKGKSKQRHKQDSENRNGGKQPNSNSVIKKCTRCGLSKDHKKCPAKGTRCKFCNKFDHWKSVCHKRLSSLNVNSLSNHDFTPQSVQSVVYPDQVDSDSDSDLLQISATNYANKSGILSQDDKWLVKLSVASVPLSFRIDTGARCCIMVKSEFDKLKFDSSQVKSTSKTLKSYSNHTITPLCSVSVPVRNQNTIRDVHFEVVDIVQENVISGRVAEELGLIERINSIAHKLSEFPDLVNTTGTLPGEYRIRIDPNATPVIHPTRRQPASLKPRIIAKLKEMESDGYIAKVDKPTDWVSSMVVSFRKDKIRICIDPKDLNKAVLREHHPMKTVEEVVAEIPGCKVFSVLDAQSGFLQVKLDKASSYLTTFNTPIGRYRWLRLPFGIKSSPEIYQKIMDQMLDGISHAAAIIDDILIAGRTVEEHDKVLKQVVERATSYNLKLNFDKCRIRKSEVPYVGHIVTSEGLKPDPDKVRAITSMSPPTDKEGVRRFLGIIQYLSKFIPNMSQIDAPLRSLLKSDVEFSWQHEHQASFDKLIVACSSTPVLAYYDVNRPVVIQCDSSKDGLGAVLLQGDHPIAYTSRALTDSEKRYAQIEKELLSVVHACRKFHCYIIGKPVIVYNDHKPLEQIFKKPLLSAPLRLQRMFLRLQCYDLDIKFMPGKELLVADALSRAYLPEAEIELDLDIKSLDLLSVSRDKFIEIASHTNQELSVLYDVIVKGWPDTRSEVPVEIRQFWDSRDQLSVMDGVIFKGLRIVIPPSLRSQMLKLIHTSHLGMIKCKQRAREVLYWPCMNDDIERIIRDCSVCAEYQNMQTAEPLKPTRFPKLPYAEVGCDLFDFQSNQYLIVVDYYSRYIDVARLHRCTTKDTISALTQVFATHGIPQILRSDNGPQFNSKEFREYCNGLGIEHVTSSPNFQSSNGLSERAVQTVKRLWKKAADPYLALLDYRTTPIEGLGLSPSQLLMGRRPRNTLPTACEILKPTAYNTAEVKRFYNSEREKQKHYYDSRRGAKELPPLNNDSEVRIALQPGKEWSPALVESKAGPRSYNVVSGNRKYRRNRKHIRQSTRLANTQIGSGSSSGSHVPELTPFEVHDELLETLKSPVVKSQSSTPEITQSFTPHKVGESSEITTRSGRTVKVPQKLNL